MALVINSAARPYESSRERDNESEREVEKVWRRVETGEGVRERKDKKTEGKKIEIK